MERNDQFSLHAVMLENGGDGSEAVVGVLPRVHIFNTYFFRLYIDRCYDHVQRWAKVTRSVDLFALDVILMPVNVSGVHWAIIGVDFPKRSILYYDSMGAGIEFVEHAKAYIESEYRDRTRLSFNFTGWRFGTAAGVPRQENGFDCSVFMCRVADCLAADRPLSFTQSDIPFFRNRMACEILQQSLYKTRRRSQPVTAGIPASPPGASPSQIDSREPPAQQPLISSTLSGDSSESGVGDSSSDSDGDSWPRKLSNRRRPSRNTQSSRTVVGRKRNAAGSKSLTVITGVRPAAGMPCRMQTRRANRLLTAAAAVAAKSGTPKEKKWETFELGSGTDEPRRVKPVIGDGFPGGVSFSADDMFRLNRDQCFKIEDYKPEQYMMSVDTSHGSYDDRLRHANEMAKDMEGKHSLSNSNNNGDIFNTTTSGPTSRKTGATTASKIAGGGGGFAASAFFSEANAGRIVNTLCTVRAAALKLDHMLSIQDSSMLNPQLQKNFECVRQSADFMLEWQMRECLVKALGEDWRSKLAEFDETSFAAASIGQVHRARLHDGRQVALKIQYPGVADGIDSDIDNFMSMMKYWNILPKGLCMDNVMKVARQELTWECDYTRGAEFMQKFRELLANDAVFAVPDVISELSTKHVLTTELVPGVSLDQMVSASQEVRNKIALNIIRLCLAEVFEFRVMQTDPNWADFFIDPEKGKLYLLDFGATREFNKPFIDDYIQIIKGSAEKDRKKVYEHSKKLGFLTGYETKEMQDAHLDAVMILGEGFTSDTEFDFGKQVTTRRIQHLLPMVEQRLTPPPEESYSLHRKTSGCFLLCAKLNAKVRSKPIFDRVWDMYQSGQTKADGGGSSTAAVLDCNMGPDGWSAERRGSMRIAGD